MELKVKRDLTVLSELKEYRCDKVDVRTTELIALGHEYPPLSGQLFSLSERAQINILGVHSWKDILTYPKAYTTKDNKITIHIEDAIEAETFCLNGLATKDGHLSSGNDFIKLINACETIPEVNAIIDNR